MSPRHVQRNEEWISMRLRFAMVLMFGIVIGLMYSLAILSLPAQAAPRVTFCYADGPHRLPHEDVACYPKPIKQPRKYDVHFVGVRVTR